MLLNEASHKRLAKVDPLLREVIEYAAATAPSGVDFQIVQGLRTQAEQNALYAQGRTKPGKVVTWTRNSNHMDKDKDGDGDAIDFQAYVNGKGTWNDKAFIPVANHIKKAAMILGIKVQWGYDLWKKDYGHIQLVPGQTKMGMKPVTTPKPVEQTKKVDKAPPLESTKLLQDRLNKWKFYNLTVDGDFGSKSVAAFKDFQKWMGLKDTLGKLTDAEWNILKTDPYYVQAVKFFVAKGMPIKSACALVGGFQQESYRYLDPRAHGDKEEVDHAYGISQVRASRKLALDLLAKQRGTTWDDFPTQLQYAWNELMTTEKRTGKLLRDAKTMDEATKAAIGFFRPHGFTWEHPENGHGYANRVINANKLYDLIYGSRG